ncbi:hypothetical protein MAQ5080_01479 [Marinomonas aquimarina]|uniref:SPOR domain-containing protein n=1 Tax=Marinomonas aquimarina TaxID=295068 RepID=A0A1A8TCR8_9GAMM|nr:AAA family ATPase [Marinomonas aquimarina]SBS29710.1 hypothetical protein MAQ5080_01479 [Marinomonas aquimarina]
MAEPNFQFDLEEALDQQPKVMLRNPFGSNDTQVFFSSEERNQQLGMLEHLSRYSNLLSVVEGGSGSGKTRFLQEFIRLQNDSAILCHVKASMLMTAGQLLQAIYAGYADVLDSSQAGTSFGPLLKFAHEAEAKGQKAIILIDNAHELNTDAIIMLMDMMSLATESQEVPHIALFTEHSLARNLDAYQSSRYEQLSHELELAPFSLEQTRAYLLHRVRAIGGGINLPFNERQIKKIYQQSGGMPGAINKAALAMMGDAQAAESLAGEKKSWFKRPKTGLSFGFPVVHMALMSVIMLGILVAVVFNDGEEDAPTNSTRVAPIGQNAPRQASSETIARIEAMQRQIGQDSPMSLPPIPAEALQPNQVQSNNSAQGSAPSSNIASAPIRLAPVESSAPAPDTDNSPVVSTPILQTAGQAQATNEPKTESVPLEQTASRDPFDKTQAWLERNPNRYTLQLLGTHNQDTVQEFIRDQGSLDAFSYFHALHNGRDWYVVVYGEYRNRSEAIAAVENLPQGLRQLNPWARSVRGIQQDIRRAGAQ